MSFFSQHGLLQMLRSRILFEDVVAVIDNVELGKQLFKEPLAEGFPCHSDMARLLAHEFECESSMFFITEDATKTPKCESTMNFLDWRTEKLYAVPRSCMLLVYLWFV